VYSYITKGLKDENFNYTGQHVLSYSARFDDDSGSYQFNDEYNEYDSDDDYNNDDQDN